MENCRPRELSKPRSALLSPRHPAAYSSWIKDDHAYIALFACADGDTELALSHLEAAKDAAAICDTLPDEVPYTSALMCGRSYKSEDQCKNYTHTEQEGLLSFIEQKGFDIIRGTERFQNVKKLSGYAASAASVPCKNTGYCMDISVPISNDFISAMF